MKSSRLCLYFCPPVRCSLPQSGVPGMADKEPDRPDVSAPQTQPLTFLHLHITLGCRLKQQPFPGEPRQTVRQWSQRILPGGGSLTVRVPSVFPGHHRACSSGWHLQQLRPAHADPSGLHLQQLRPAHPDPSGRHLQQLRPAHSDPSGRHLQQLRPAHAGSEAV